MADPKTIPMLDSEGARYNIPADQYNDAIGAGLKRAGTLDLIRSEPGEAASSLESKSQEEMDKAIGVESRGRSTLNKLGHSGLSSLYGIGAVGQDLLGMGMALTKPKTLATAATGAIHPAIPFSIFGAQGAQGMKEAVQNPSPGNVRQALTGGAAMAAGAAGVSEAKPPSALNKSLERIKLGSHSDVLNELEQFRKDVKAKPSARQRDVANVKHSALKQRIDAEWAKVHNIMEVKTTDVDAVHGALKELAKVDPSVAQWIAEHMEESKSGQSTTRPFWEEVKALRSKLSRLQTNKQLDPVIGQKLPTAIKGLDAAMENAAKEAGVLDAYKRNQQLTRHLENIKHHTAYSTSPVKPSPLWGIAGMVGGAHSVGDTGATSEIGGAFIGKSIMEHIGRGISKKGQWSIPKESIEGEKAVWKQLGEKPPKGVSKTKVQMRAGKNLPKSYPKNAPGVSGGAPDARGTKGGAPTDPWANVKYDRAATQQAIEEQKSGKLPQGMSVVQRAQQIKEQLMGQSKP